MSYYDEQAAMEDRDKAETQRDMALEELEQVKAHLEASQKYAEGLHVQLELAKSFHNVAVAERDHERYLARKAEAENRQLKKELAALGYN